MDKTLWGVVSAAVEQLRRKANMVARGDREIRPLRLTTQNIPPNRIGDRLRGQDSTPGPVLAQSLNSSISSSTSLPLD